MTIAARRAIGVSDHDPLAAAEDRVDVLHAVASLPRPQREALVLVVWLGYATEEAGTLLGIEPGSVRGRLHRARQALRRQLGGRDG
jgi:RNA polymerase sigma factor (sigma-70 family)